MIDLDTELANAVTSIPPDRLEQLTALGIPESFVCSGPHRVGFGRVQTHGDFYEPTDDGDLAIIVAELQDDEVRDLVAFYPDRPGRWWLRRLEVEILGAEHMGETVFPLMVHRTPLDWLQSAGHGICIVDWEFDPLARLAFAGPLKTTLPMKRRLEKRIQQVALGLFDIEVCNVGP